MTEDAEVEHIGSIRLQNVLDREALLHHAHKLRLIHAVHAMPLQTGFSLSHAPWLWPTLEPLLSHTQPFLGLSDFIKSASSFRLQPSAMAGHLPPHQDACVLGERHGKPFLTIWVPLVDLTWNTPTLRIERFARRRALPHDGDASGYLKLNPTPDDIDLQPVDGLKVGDALIIFPLTIHCTYVPMGGGGPERMSLDIRIEPAHWTDPRSKPQLILAKLRRKLWT